MKVVQELNEVALANLLRGPDGAVARDMMRRGLRVQTVAKRRCPANHGRLRGSITVRPIVRAGGIGVEVGSDVSYALAVHEGTGIYGPHSSKIVPVNGAYLVFRPRGSDRVVFAKSVRGQKGVPYLRDALPAALRI